ncbi:DUF305 domain-containing protein [Longispora albida]|uniref:DUF305 domain-containing protein n=1 Tax=Longispora albida TaxID=203523 RepID=UPI00037EF87A|nr:DUF305 domain-containing protein [Longispora albida]
MFGSVRSWWLAVVAVLALVAGFALAQFWPGAPGDDSAEAGFARDMSSHHAQAVEMAMLGYTKAENPRLRTLGYDIALTQQAQIGMMDAWLAEWNLRPTGSQPKMAWMPDGKKTLSPEGLMPGMASPAELERLRAATGRDFDILFSQLMLRHHLGGIHMVDAVVDQADDKAVADFAGSMKAAQQKEIAIFNGLLTEMGAKPL